MRLAGFDTADTGNDTDDSELPALVVRIADLLETLERPDPQWPPEEDLEKFAAGELDQLSSSR